MSQRRATISLEGVDLLELLGHQDVHLRRLEDSFPGTLVVRGDRLVLEGEEEDVEQMAAALRALLQWAQHGRPIDAAAIEQLLQGAAPPAPAYGDELLQSAAAGTAIYARTQGQQRYVEAMRTSDVVFAIGPAGTGKTYLAVVLAVNALRRRDVERILLVRPAVEAGEQLGFLPGDLREKVNPYLRPLYDALLDTLGAGRLERHLSRGIIEVAPLAYMRGRTLRHAFVILDEAQNTTLTQMKMFLTRIGEGTRAIVTGDVTQIDLSDPASSGLVRVRRILDGVDGVAFIELGESDILRHPLVRRIVAAFEGPAAGLAGEKESAAAQAPRGEKPAGRSEGAS